MCWCVLPLTNFGLPLWRCVLLYHAACHRSVPAVVVLGCVGHVALGVQARHGFSCRVLGGCEISAEGQGVFLTELLCLENKHTVLADDFERTRLSALGSVLATVGTSVSF